MNCYETLGDKESCEACEMTRNVNCIKCGLSLGSNSFTCSFCHAYEYDTDFVAPQVDVEPEEKETCKNCRFFTTSNHCRRYPPTVVQQGNSNCIFIFPTVESNSWCGEWRTR